MIPHARISLAEGLDVPVYRLNTVILGSGAAGMNCAVQLYQNLSARAVGDAHDRLAVVTAGIQLGASRMSGSDKQTYYKVGTHPARPDAALDFAKTLTAGGCMHGDLALAEGACSLRAFFHLVDVGVPFPHDPSGNYPGYKTDHDPRARATSAGPKTSFFMSTSLQRKAERFGIRIFDRHEAVHLLTAQHDGRKRIVGLLTLDTQRLAEPAFGLTVFLCENLVLAAGGPGALFEASVYPLGQVGAHGLAFRAGLRAHNMIEWQFGLASTSFRWNVSGTYMQALPRIFSTDENGADEREFLTDHFPTTAELATNIFLKGYQWPFDAQRLQGHQSSLVDLFVTRETRQLGRRVYLDFRRNPVPGKGKEPFALARLEPEARQYLEQNGAVQGTPIERLAHMNPLAIDIYREHDIDLHTDPLEIAVCAQHHNGGFIVDHWWQSTIPGAFVIGEMAGTHGIKRPGGAALNSGQSGALRAAEYIAQVRGGDVAEAAILGAPQQKQIADAFAKLRSWLGASANALPVHDTLKALQIRSSASAAHLRRADDVNTALKEARAMAAQIAARGLRAVGPDALPLAVQVDHLAITHVALLEALRDYLARGGGSRGSYVVLAEDGIETGTPYRFLPENESMRKEIAEIELTDPTALTFRQTLVPVRPIPEKDDPFEVMWATYRSGDVYRAP